MANKCLSCQLIAMGCLENILRPWQGSVGKWLDPKRLGDGPQEKKVVGVLAVSD